MIYRVVLGLSIGIAFTEFWLCKAYFPFSRFSIVLFYIIVGCLLFSGVVILISKLYWIKNKDFNKFEILLFYLILLVFGSLLTFLHDPRTSLAYYGFQNATSFKILLNETPIQKGEYLHFTAKVIVSETKQGWMKSKGLLLVTMKASLIKTKFPEYGEVWVIHTKPEKIRGNPHPAFFNFALYQNFHGIFYQAFLKNGDFENIHIQKGNPLFHSIFLMNRVAVMNLERQLKDPSVASFLAALLLGDRSKIPESVNSLYTQTGTVHILSISGMHIGLLFGLFYILLSPLKRINRYGKFIFQGLILLLLWFYALFSGASPPVMRSAWMITFFSLSTLLRRKADTSQILASSCLVQLMLDPMSLLDLSFQLSYTALFSLVKFFSLFQKLFPFKNNPATKWITTIASTFLSSISAQLGVLPLSLFYFHQYPVYFLLANLLVLPVSSIILYLGVVYYFLLSIHFPSTFIEHLLEFWIKFLNKGLLLITKFPYGLIRGIYWKPYEIAGLCLIGILLYAFLKSYRNYYLILLISLILFGISMRMLEIRNMNSQNEVFIQTDRKGAFALFVQGKIGILLKSKPGDSDAYLIPLVEYYHLEKLYRLGFKEEKLLQKKFKTTSILYSCTKTLNEYIYTIVYELFNKNESSKLWIQMTENQIATQLNASQKDDPSPKNVIGHWKTYFYEKY